MRTDIDEWESDSISVMPVESVKAKKRKRCSVEGAGGVGSSSGKRSGFTTTAKDIAPEKAKAEIEDELTLRPETASNEVYGLLAEFIKSIFDIIVSEGTLDSSFFISSSMTRSF